MAIELKKNSKSETLTIRLDPKTRFVLEFMSRRRGQTITTVVERSIFEAANQSNNSSHNDTSWEEIWDVSEGIRSIKIAKEKSLYPTYEDDRLLEFVDAHSEFFYFDNNGNRYKRWSIDLIWPNIKTYMAEWFNERGSDYFKAGRSMVRALKLAGVQAPDWPRNTNEEPPKKTGSMSDAIDDDIPF